jgi:hypothetical protein
MFADRFGPSSAGGRSRYARGHRRGRRGPFGGGVLPYLAAALLARAAWRRAQGRFGPGHPGRGPWGWDEGKAPHAHGGWGDAPWRRGGWRRGPGREQFRGLRAEIGPLVALLRDAFRRGVDARQVDEIGVVLGEARRRIAAILSDAQPPRTEV